MLLAVLADAEEKKEENARTHTLFNCFKTQTSGCQVSSISLNCYNQTLPMRERENGGVGLEIHTPDTGEIQTATPTPQKKFHPTTTKNHQNNNLLSIFTDTKQHKQVLRGRDLLRHEIVSVLCLFREDGFQA